MKHFYKYLPFTITNDDFDLFKLENSGFWKYL